MTGPVHPHRERGKAPLGEPDATIRGLLAAGVSDEELVAAAAPFASGERTVERVIVDVLGRYSPDWIPIAMWHRAQAHWYRRAVADGQVWAMYDGGRRWSFMGSDDAYDRPPSGSADVVSRDEARGWIAMAADLGDPRAGLDAARWFPDDARAVGWLRRAYDDADLGSDEDRNRLAAAALMLARILEEAGDAEAGEWYRAAATMPPWQECDLHPSTWQEAVHEYALWCHWRGYEDLCTAVAMRLVQNAADLGPDDRNYMNSEWKTYRNEWQMTRGAESARQLTMRHLLEEHDLQESLRLEIALLLSNCRWFSADGDLGVIVDVLERQPSGGPALAQLLLRADAGRTPRVPITGTQAWAAVHWLLADAVPLILAFAGLQNPAKEFRRLVPDDIEHASAWEWGRGAQAFEGWDELNRGWEFDFSVAAAEDRRSRQSVIDAIRSAGLGERLSPFATNFESHREEFLAADLSDTSWRLLRGSPVWLGMYAATAAAGQSESWIAWWDLAGRFVAYALRGAALKLGRDLGVDWSRYDDDQQTDHKRRWRELKEALERGFASFIGEASAL